MLESVLANMKEEEGLKNPIRHIFCFTASEESFYNKKVLHSTAAEEKMCSDSPRRIHQLN